MEETENLVNNIIHLAALLHFDRYRNRDRPFVCYVFFFRPVLLLTYYLPCILLAYGVGGWSLMRRVDERGKLVNSK